MARFGESQKTIGASRWRGPGPVGVTARATHAGVGLPELRSGQGRTDKLPGSGCWHPPFPAWSPKAPARSLPPIIKRIAASCLNSLYRHPASVRRSCASPSMAARAPSSRAPGLRSVALVRSPLPRSSSLRLPDARSLRPGYTRRRYFLRLANVIGDSNGFNFPTLVLASPLRVAFRRAASCHRAGSLAGHPGPPAFGECALIQAGGHRARRLRRHPVVAVAIAPVRSRVRGRCAWSVSCRRTGGHPARQQKRPPSGDLGKRRFKPVHRVDTSTLPTSPFISTIRNARTLRRRGTITHRVDLRKTCDLRHSQL